jgi:hypothetical protein
VTLDVGRSSPHHDGHGVARANFDDRSCERLCPAYTRHASHCLHNQPIRVRGSARLPISGGGLYAELHSEAGMSYFSLIARDAGPSEITMTSRISPLGDRTNVSSSLPPMPTKVVSVSGVKGSFGNGPEVLNGLLN